jgi:hypothetical protein
MEVVSVQLFLLMEGPVLVEVSTAPKGPEPEDGLGTFESPSGAGDVQAVLDEMAAGALDDARRDGVLSDNYISPS